MTPRPKIGPQKSFACPEDLFDAVEAAADEAGIVNNTAMRRLIYLGLTYRARVLKETSMDPLKSERIMESIR